MKQKPLASQSTNAHVHLDPTINADVSRRDFLLRGTAGFGGLALAHLFCHDLPSARSAETTSKPAGPITGNPLSARLPHFPATAKNVIFLFMEGGPSHIDLFDPKPALAKYAGQPLPSSFKPVITAMGEANAPLLASKRKWQQFGEGGLWISDWLPHLSQKADDLAVIRSLYGEGINHAGGVCQMNTGSIIAGRPSLGAWVTYGLGTANENLPAFVVLQDNRNQIVGGPRNWGTGFMPAVYQGTDLQPGNEPIPHLHPPPGLTNIRQQRKLSFLEQLNTFHQQHRSEQTELDARLRSYELAFRMQVHAPDAVDFASESTATRKLYGMDQKETANFGQLCLLARRLVERGVRFVQLYHGAGSKWDAHNNIEGNHSKLCREMDLPVTGLLTDLKARGLLEDTLVIWGGEFGRTPMSEKGNGRDHNPTGFTMWLAGGGVRGGQTIGATDEIGLYATEDRLHLHDFHATILYLLGLHHMDLVYMHKGRPERPTLNEGEPATQVTQASTS